MFSGYKQREAFTYEVLLEVERFVQENEGRELDLEAFDEGDLHRLGKWKCLVVLALSFILSTAQF